MTDDPQQALIDRQAARIRYLEAQVRSAWEIVEWKDEQLRVYRRVIERLGGPNAEPLRQDHT